MGDDSYPIEIAWLEPDGTIPSLLIRPAWDWIDWSAKAEALHGITRADLARDGLTPTDIVTALSERWTGRTLLSDAPAWDAHWLERLWRTGSRDRSPWSITGLEDWLERHLRAHGEPEPAITPRIRTALAQAQASQPPTHRAAADVAHLAYLCREALTP